MPIPEPLTGDARRDQLAQERRRRRGGLVASAVWLVAVLAWDVVHGTWSGVGRAVVNAVYAVVLFGLPVSGAVVVSRRMRAQAGRTDLPGLAETAWAGAPSFGPGFPTAD